MHNTTKKATDYIAAVPTLLQLGADDNWTWPKPCQALAEEATSKGGQAIIVDLYEGAAHSFDHPKSKRRTITLSNDRKVRLGTHPEARAKSIERINTYLRSAFQGQ